ncbi:MAG: ABC transporter ATP-binding protein/permease [Anaerolineae bacterium]|nr:ABC transporter ATP-binding protein/permease [Anaerolineae bacterium]
MNSQRLARRDTAAPPAGRAAPARPGDDSPEEDLHDGSITDRYLVRMLGRFLLPYRWQLACILALLLAVSGLNLLLPYLVMEAVDGPISQGRLDDLAPFGAAYILTIAFIFLLRFAYTFWLQTIGQNALLNLRQTLYEHIIRQDMAYFNKTPVGKITARMSNDIEALTELLSTSIVMVASNMLTLMGIIVVMFLLNWRLALISLVTLPVTIGLSLYFRRIIRGISMRFHKLIGDYQAFLNEQFGGMLIVQLFARQQRTLDEFEAVNSRYYGVHTELRDVYTLYASLLQFTTTIGLGIVLYGGGSGVLAGWASLGALIAFIDYTRRTFEPVMQLSEQFAQIQTAFSAGERVARMLSVSSSIKEPAQPVALTHFDRTLAFEKVVFGYEADYPVLRGIDLRIRADERVAIVGATGAGKTSLVKLLARYYDVQGGRVCIGGVDIRDLSLADLRRYVTVVPQNPYCFNGTIADNLRLFDPSVTYEQMVAAAETACAHPFIMALPGGYDYALLPGGGNLSHGQRQLLALARALIHSPHSILVLDEATSNIDTETEALIQAGLKQVLAQRTSLIIAHRLSTIRDADRIIVMRLGEIIEEGTHDSLLALDGTYAALYHRQFEEITLTAAPATATATATAPDAALATGQPG